MSEQASTNLKRDAVRLWLSRAKVNSTKCFICNRIVEGNSPDTGDLKALKISGIDLTPETQFAHLARCVGRGEGCA